MGAHAAALGCPRGGAERDAVKQNHWRAEPVCQQPHADAGGREVEKGLLDLGTDGVEQIGFGTVDACSRVMIRCASPFTRPWSVECS